MAKLLSCVTLLSCVVLILTDSEPQREQVLFEKVDKNLDGYLTRAELDSVFLLFDVNHDNSITKAEFDTDWTTTFNLGMQKEADVLFQQADANDDNVIDHKDLPYIFHFFDSNSDGNVSIDEFLTQWGALTLLASGGSHGNTDHPTGHDTTTVQFSVTQV